MTRRAGPQPGLGVCAGPQPRLWRVMVVGDLVARGLGSWWAPALAFAAGVVSFASPCVFPLVPGYLAFVSGGEREERRPVVPILLFILGFAAVFTLLGVSIGALRFVKSSLGLRIAGVVVLLF